MRVFRASRRPADLFDPLDSSGSVAGAGWRWNDPDTELLYVADSQALALLEVTVRPGWESSGQVVIAIIEVPDHSIVNPEDLGILLPSNWNNRPAAADSQLVGRQFIKAVAGKPKITGLRVPSVISSTDFNILLDPAKKASFSVAKARNLIPFSTLRSSKT